jgi:hypothetical protein
VVALQNTPIQHYYTEAFLLLLEFSEAKLKPEHFEMQVFNSEAVPLIFGLTTMLGNGTASLSACYHFYQLIYFTDITTSFLMKSTTLRATKKGDFLKMCTFSTRENIHRQ